MAFQLPNVGDIQGQAQAGQNLIAQINQGDTEGLLAAGMSAIGGALGSSPGGAVFMGAVEGALSGYAMYGPVGAAIGAAVSLAEGAVASFSPADSVVGIYGVSPGTTTITTRVQSLGSAAANILNNHPAGWAMADYLSSARPPSSGNQSVYVESMAAIGAFIQISAPEVLWKGEMGLPSLGNFFGNATDLSVEPPLCTPVWFQWFQSSQIVDCSQDLYFGSGGAGGSSSALLETWISSTHATGVMTQTQIVQKALAGLLDPFYFAASLYGWSAPSGLTGAGFQTWYWNPDALNAMATFMAMRSSGASTQAIVSELLIQSAILSQTGVGGTNGYLFHRIVDDLIRMANKENAAAGIVAASELSTWDKVGGVLLGAGLGAVGGILAYSAFKRQLPIVTVRTLGSKIVGLRRFVP